MNAAKDAVEQAIGVYQHMLSSPELMLTRSNDALDLESALKRALRPSFTAGPPTREKEVQDAVELILIALGTIYTRDTEVAPVGGKSFKPDFILERMDLALEVKLSKPSHGAAAIQEELAADVAAYATKWKRILFVVYDLGAIANPHQFESDNLKKLQAPVIIVKH